MGRGAGSKLGKEYVKAVYCNPAYLTYTQGTSCEMPGWMKHKLKSRRNINNLRYADDTTLMSESEEELKSLLMKVKEEQETWVRSFSWEHPLEEGKATHSSILA